MTERTLRLLEVLRGLHCIVRPGATILDFGCGGGTAVECLRRAGFVAYGCDPRLPNTQDTQALQRQGWLHQMPSKPLRIPFPDATFDIILSDQVFEHIRDYPAALAELQRVMRPEGSSLHVFPSRYRLIEAHVRVPLSSLNNRGWWLSGWAHLGVRNQFQKGLSAGDTTRTNQRYLEQETNYLSKRAIRDYFGHHFNQVVFCEDIYLRHSLRGGRFLRRLPEPIQGRFGDVFSTCYTRVVWAAHPKLQ